MKENPATSAGVAKVVGMQSLNSDDDRRTAAERLAKLVLIRIGIGANGYKAEVLKNWIKQHQNEGWEKVSEEGGALLEQLYPDPRARSEVQANVRLALLDPQTFEGEIQSFLAPWQQALDKHIADVRDAGEKELARTTQPTNAVGAAQARVNFIKACEDKFFDPNGGLLAFLKGDPQAAPERLALFSTLQQKKEEDDQAQDQIKLA